jgi:carboxymethylenebutenolidase
MGAMVNLDGVTVYRAEPTVAPRGELDRVRQDPVEQARLDGRIAVTGFCFGGTYSFALAAADPRVRAAVPFYGTAPDADAVARIACPVLALYGEDDPRIMATLPEARKAMADAGVAFTEKIYPGARHAFFNDTNATAYDAAAAGDAWARTLAFLAGHLGKPLPSDV